jgi:HAD superfamily hydrolase (TIGR01509 family)
MKTTVLFDLGGTLAGYYTRAEFPPILERAIGEVCGYLAEEGLLHDDAASRWERVRAEDHEDADHRVRPLGERLLRIFQLDLAPTSPRVADLCARFMQPIFALACLYEDTVEVLDDLTARGVRMAVVTNTPWGSPAALWHGEIERLGLARHIETVVSCAEVGWRKPAPPIFQRALAKLNVSAKECLFVGDDPRWDIAGPRAVGIDALLIERGEPLRHPEERPIRSLRELWSRLEEYP